MVAEESRVNIAQSALTPKLLEKIDAYCRAANYLAVGQIYLYDNPLLKRPLALTDVKQAILPVYCTSHRVLHPRGVIDRADISMRHRRLFPPGSGGIWSINHSPERANRMPGRKTASTGSHRVRTFQARWFDGAGLLLCVVPLAWFPRLVHGTPAQRANWRLIGGGAGIHWPDLDEDVSAEGLLAGRRSGESQESLRRWLQERKVG